MDQEYFKSYYEQNKETMDKRSKEWKIKNKEAWNKYQAEYKRKKYRKEKLLSVEGTKRS